jgi:hypothetical protein
MRGISLLIHRDAFIELNSSKMPDNRRGPRPRMPAVTTKNRGAI